MKTPRFFNKAAVALHLKEPPRRRGLGKKNPLRAAVAGRGEAGGPGSAPPATGAGGNEKALTLWKGPGSAPPATVDKARLLPNGATQIELRGYDEVVGKGGINSDWAISALTEDADVWQNSFLMRSRMRDLYKTDSYFTKYTEESWANTFGADGITCRMRIKETEDRVVYAPDEKGFLVSHARRRERIATYQARKFGTGRAGTPLPAAAFGAQGTERPTNALTERPTRANATIQVGDLDLYANKLIEDGWRVWKRREYCTVTGVLSYIEVCQIRLLSAARDGDFFLRHIRDPGINKFGYSLQLINSEWCDFLLNSKAANGNEIRMGIERDKWGKRVAYYFVTRQPFDWQFSIPSGFSQANPKTYTRIPAEEIIHYARYKDGDSTRPAPWGVSNILISRHLGKYQESEVAAARVGANKMGFFTSNVVPEGGLAAVEVPDPMKTGTIEAEPASFHALPWGVDFKDWSPQHPNQNFPAFRKEMLRAWCAGMPGANYNIIANDLEGVNYSSGRLGMLDERELWKLIQKFDIEVAERPIFEAWLEMALMTGAIPLPLARFDKFNKPIFRGRRWAWVDPMKEVQARAMEVANKFNSRTRIIEDSDIDADFEEILFELAEEEMMMAELGMDPTPVVGKTNPQGQQGGEEDATDGADGDGANGRALAPSGAADGNGVPSLPTKDMNLLQLVELIRATQPPSQPAVTVNVPEIKVPPPVVTIGELKVPEQKAPIVNFNPIVKVPEQKAAVINVAAPIVNVAAPEVNITNDIEIPTTKKIKVERDSDGKLSGIEVEKE